MPEPDRPELNRRRLISRESFPRIHSRSIISPFSIDYNFDTGLTRCILHSPYDRLNRTDSIVA